MMFDWVDRNASDRPDAMQFNCLYCGPHDIFYDRLKMLGSQRRQQSKIICRVHGNKFKRKT